MDEYRDQNGFIDIDLMNIKNIEKVTNRCFSFIYNEQKYYYKRSNSLREAYNELLANELAHDFGLACVDYDLAVFDGFIGNISPSMIAQDEDYISMEELLQSVSPDLKNNLEDIWTSLYMFPLHKNIIAEIMEQLCQVFLFDSLIANQDRHDRNMGVIIKNDQFHLAKIFDNEKMLFGNNSAGAYSSLEVDPVDKLTEDQLLKFLTISDKKYYRELKDKLWIIEPDNIRRVLVRVENKIHATIPIRFKEEIMNLFAVNLRIINATLQQYCDIQDQNKVSNVHT